MVLLYKLHKKLLNYDVTQLIRCSRKSNFFRAENTEKIEEYETKISNILSGKVETIFQMKEEVEAEYSDRMSGTCGAEFLSIRCAGHRRKGIVCQTLLLCALVVVL